jgi:hypothetical protein
VESVLFVHSLGGGTGSGLGSRLLEAVRDEWPAAALCDAVVAPFSGGDTPTQHYNTVLALSAAQRCADAVLFFGNDDVLARAGAARRAGATLAAGATPSGVAEARARGSSGGGGGAWLEAGLSARDLNAVIAEALAGVVLPVRAAGGGARAVLRRNAAADGRGAGAGDGRPAWCDVGVGAPAGEAPFSAGGAAGEGEGAGEFGERGGWIAASVRGGSAGANLADILGAEGGGGAPPHHAPLHALPFDLAGLLNDTVASPACKFLDVRAARPPPPAPGRPPLLPHSPAASWAALGEALVEAVPRYDGAGRPVATRAARLVVRGASAAEAALAAGGGRAGGAQLPPPPPPPPPHAGKQHRHSPPGAGMAPLPPHWPGLPAGGGGDWERISLTLTRAHNWAAGADLAAVRSATASAAQPGLPGPAAAAARSLTLVANSDAFVAHVVRTVARADALLGVGAYTHWYERYGVGREAITGAMHDMLDVVEAYRPAGR